MNTLTFRLFAATAVFAFAGSADAAAPKLSGKYAYHLTQFCASTLKVTKGPGVKSVTIDGTVTTVVNQQVVLDAVAKQNGLISSNVGYITFNSPVAGQLTISGGTLIEGAAFRVQGKTSLGWSSVPDDTQIVPYSINADGTLFTFGAGEEAAVFQMVYADPLDANKAVYRTAYLTRRSSADGDNNLDCVTTVHATRQND